MKQLAKRTAFFLVLLLIAGFTTMAQQSQKSINTQNEKFSNMKTYLIERNIPGAGLFTAAELKGISQKSCTVLKEMGPQIEWLHSYVAGDKIMCVYKAESEALLREHAKRGGFPADRITEVANVISPATAN